MKIKYITMVRTTLRILVILAIFSLAGLNRYFNLKSRLGGQIQIEASPTLSLIDRAFGSSPHLGKHRVVATGGLWSFQAHGARISDPLAVMDGVLASHAIQWTLIASIFIPIIFTLIFGRAFCGWLCPMSLLGEAVRGIRRILERVHIVFMNFSVSHRIKYAVLVMGAIAAVIFGMPIFYGFYPPRIISDWVRDCWGRGVMMSEVALIGVILTLELLLVERLWCKCLCPGGAMYSALGNWRLIKMVRNEDACTNCGRCDTACPYDLQPSELKLNGECDNCGMCREACNDNALQYKVRK